MSRYRLTQMIGLGQVIKQHVRGDVQVVKIRMQKMALDKNLLMYFPQKKDKWAVDFKKECKLGDIVVIKNMDEKFGDTVCSKVDYVMYAAGAVRDPITGRLCRGTDFVDEEERKVQQNAAEEANLIAPS